MNISMKVHFLKTEWSDIIILQNKKEIALIDTGFEEQFEQISLYLKDLVPEPITIKFILNTHFHRDHYGCISKLTETFNVEKVYLKEYSGLDCTTAWGTPADDEYRKSEMEKFQKLKADLSEKNLYIPVEGVEKISFANTDLYLYNTENTIRQIYEDESNPETYHKIMFSENTNSLVAFMEVDGRKLFFGGDSNDLPQPHPLADRMLYKVAQKINKCIDLYKVPHHGTWHTGLPETLEIFKPKIVVFTNSEEYVSKESDALTNLKNANPKAKILWTKNSTHVIDTDHDLGVGLIGRALGFFAVWVAGIVAGYFVVKGQQGYVKNMWDIFGYIILMPVYMAILLVPPLCFASVPIYSVLGYTAYKWFRKGKFYWLAIFAVLFIPCFLLLLIFIDNSMGI